MTPRQSKCLGIIKTHIETHGYSPTVGEISKAMGLVSRAGSAQHLDKLEDGGLIKRSNEGARNIRLCNQASQTSGLSDLEKAATALVFSKITINGSSVVVGAEAFNKLEKALAQTAHA